MDKRLAFIPLVALVLGGCSLPGVGGNTSVVEQVAQKAEEKAAEQAVLKSCPYEKDVCKYMATMMTAYNQPMVMKTTTVMKQYGTSISTVKMDGKGNMNIVSMKDGKEESAMIMFDNATYFKDMKDNSWYKMVGGDDKGNTSIFNPKAMIDDFKEIAEDTASKMVVKKLGQEACGTLTCEKYQMDETEFKTSMIVWFDTKEFKARKIQTTAEQGTTSTVEYSYEPVTVTAPSPVKEMPDFSEMMEQNGTKMPSAEDLQKMMKDLPNAPDMGAEGE